MRAAMSNSLKHVLLLGVLLSATGCTVYVNRAESAYNEGRYLEVAEQLAVREAEVTELGQRDQLRYGLYRGLALMQLGQYEDAKPWLARARELEQSKPLLTPRQRGQLDRGWQFVEQSASERSRSAESP